MTTLTTLVLETLDSLKALNVRLLDVRHLTPLTDYMIIATGNSTRHARAMAEKTLKAAKENGFQPLGIEGGETSEWILLDLGAVVVHIMLAETRAFYNLERLWGQIQTHDKAIA